MEKAQFSNNEILAMLPVMSPTLNKNFQFSCEFNQLDIDIYAWDSAYGMPFWAFEVEHIFFLVLYGNLTLKQQFPYR